MTKQFDFFACLLYPDIFRRQWMNPKDFGEPFNIFHRWRSGIYPPYVPGLPIFQQVAHWLMRCSQGIQIGCVNGVFQPGGVETELRGRSIGGFIMGVRFPIVVRGSDTVLRVRLPEPQVILSI